MKIELTAKEEYLFGTFGNVINIDNKKYYNLPFWLEKTDKEGIFILHRLGDLPEELLEAAKDFGMDITDITDNE